MTNNTAIVEIVDRLKKEGWKEQKSGPFYINGTMTDCLMKAGEVLVIQQEFCPDEEFIEQEWGDTK